jgi:hypothetical protein
MNAEDFMRDQELIDAEINTIGTELDSQRGSVCDGVISPKHYLSSPTKTAWLLREPHDEGGGWDFKTGIIARLNGTDPRPIRSNRYFNPMRYLDYALNSDLVPYHRDLLANEHLAGPQRLLNTAFININKIPGGANVDPAVWLPYAEKFWPVVEKQFVLANPKVIIACGTVSYLERCGYLNKYCYRQTERGYYRNDKNNIIVACYHLGQRTITEEALCNELMDCLRDARANGVLL